MLLIKPILLILVKFKKLSDILDNFLTKDVHGVFVLIRKYFNRNYPKIKKITTKIVIGTVIVDSLLFFYLYKKIFSPMPLAESSSIKSYYEPLLGGSFPIYKQTEVDIETNELLKILIKEGLNIKIVNTIKNNKSEFSVSGNIIIINNDNISVFKYENPQIAERDAMIYANKYNKNKQQYMSESTHLYLKDNIVIFYLGTMENIIQPLTLFAGKSLIK